MSDEKVIDFTSEKASREAAESAEKLMREGIAAIASLHEAGKDDDWIAQKARTCMSVIEAMEVPTRIVLSLPGSLPDREVDAIRASVIEQVEQYRAKCLRAFTAQIVPLLWP